MRKVPRSFFWIDQQVIRSGLWQRLSTEAKLAYVALAASVDREGISLWGSKKIMELMGKVEPEIFDSTLSELEGLKLIVRGNELDPGLRLLNLATEAEAIRSQSTESMSLSRPKVAQPIVIQTTTTVTLGGVDVESRNSN